MSRQRPRFDGAKEDGGGHRAEVPSIDCRGRWHEDGGHGHDGSFSGAAERRSLFACFRQSVDFTGVSTQNLAWMCKGASLR